ncbi:MAG: hypothetical protein IIZ53_05310 [Ruminococcus sp.]|nr:hypothetical protein [Ruminococcus sp.]
MRFKNKGRKIYKTKEKNYYGKSPVGKAFSVVLTVLLLGGIGFIGYSVAEPIINYSKKAGDSELPQPATVPTEAAADDIGDAIGSETADTVETNKNETESLAGYSLTVNDLVNRDFLASALKRIPEEQGIEYVEVPLKAAGGKIYYASNIRTAQQSGAVQGQMPLGEIVSVIVQEGYKPIAHISTFNDNITPATFPEMGYLTLDDWSQWIDDDYEDGGKPWTSPFSPSAVDYNISVIDEVSGSGFSKVICSDFTFPEFRDSDIEYLGESVVSDDRYKAMTSAANTIYEHITNKGSTMLLEVSAADILRGSSDILQPLLLKVNTLVVDIDLDEIRYGVFTGDTVYDFSGSAAENTDKMLDLIEEEISSFKTVVKIRGNNFNPSDIVKAAEAVKEHGINSCIIGSV